MTSRVALESIRSLTFYSDALTQSRRTPPIPQLKCIGKPCSLFQPDVVRCFNDGGRGIDVDWRCQADLPDSLRFGRIEVSCEGWSGPGDPMVLKGSCALEYRLVRIPNALQYDDPYVPRILSHLTDPDYILKALFIFLWSFFLLLILYQILKSCLTRPRGASASGRPASRYSDGGWWFPGNRPDNTDQPPPYSYHNKSSPATSTKGWTPGFWTGLGLGGLAGSFWGRRRDPAPQDIPQRSRWDWERASDWWGGSTSRQAAPSTMGSRRWFGSTGDRSRTAQLRDDRGEGTSTLGTMRTSMGLGGSRVR